MIFPWQATQWETLSRMHSEKRMPHALLFAGPLGVGKREIAKALAQRVLCEKNTINITDISCGNCHACHLIAAESHPDLHIVQPEQEGQAIKIDQIRQLAEFIQNTSHQGGYRVVIIQPATAMNAYAANALLKTLEEPSPNTLLILVNDQRIPLPITIVSRCQQIRFAIPETELALSWLQHQDSSVNWSAILEATQGAPLLALEWQNQGVWPQYQNFMQDLFALSQHSADPMELAIQWKEANILWVFDMFFQWLLKLMQVQQVRKSETLSLHDIAENIPTSNLLAFASYLQRLRIDALGPYNLNQQLLLETLFIRWAQYVSS
ncbi:MAG TPA: DNA polymerase III subunit delta' [Gammaproteobacteria bacterium]|nr:DNA polymerase III subunit delta' [Gammaproteobacteria bacterium]